MNSKACGDSDCQHTPGRAFSVLFRDRNIHAIEKTGDTFPNMLREARAERERIELARPSPLEKGRVEQDSGESRDLSALYEATGRRDTETEGVGGHREVSLWRGFLGS